MKISGIPVNRESVAYRVGHEIGYIVGLPIPGALAAKSPRAMRLLSKPFKSCRRSSFVPGTAVLMADGTN
ncbi:hypothetical protein D0T12_14320 [Actinomadura spongiicola]|uniref:Uncharacterized protein n=1 Tax=Actinomadura spongiicola TaxID=2303421 RepID=A0A372GH52_9ACTN|nr:hypothetical protein [Actinomadura spongiicola]RFS84706.1 hypothetical protein D0T12_14320 [Actinomadura spongiicola]